MDNEILDEKKSQSDDQAASEKPISENNGCESDKTDEFADAVEGNIDNPPQQSKDDQVTNIDDESEGEGEGVGDGDGESEGEGEGEEDHDDEEDEEREEVGNILQSPVEIGASDSDIMSDYSPEKKKSDKISSTDRSSPSIDESAGKRDSVYESIDESFENEHSDDSSIDSDPDMVSDDDEPNEHEDANDFDVDDEEMNDLDEDDYNSDGSMEENVVHSIVDSDSEDSYQEDNQIDHYQRIFDIKKEIDKSIDTFDDGVEVKENVHKPPYQPNNNNNNNNNKQNINHNIKSNSRYRQYLKTHLNKEGFTKLLRYQSVKRSVTRLNRKAMHDYRGINRISTLEREAKSARTLNSSRKSQDSDESPKVTSPMLKERNTNERKVTSIANAAADALKGEPTTDGRKSTSNGQSVSVSGSGSVTNTERPHDNANVDDDDIILELDDIDDDYDDDKEECAKAKNSHKSDSASRNDISIDVDEPSDDLYVTISKPTNQSNRSDKEANNVRKMNDSCRLDSDSESAKNNGTAIKSGLVNGSSGSMDGKQTEKDDDDSDQSKHDEQATKSTGKSNKRKLSVSSDEEDLPPSKAARNDIDTNFPKYDKMIRRVIETSTKSLDDPEHLQSNIDQLHLEIESLAEAARTKEYEWNNILYLKKMKEDILMRLTRKKTVLQIMSNKTIDDPESLCAITDDPACIEPKTSNDSTLTPAMSFILSRSNMKSADLAKEKTNISSLSRNSQPKDHLYDNIMTSIPKSSPALQPSFGSRENGQCFLSAGGNQLDQPASKIGRQGQIKDVRSIIANFRQTHPEQIPRRGRRLKNVNQNMYLNDNATANNDALIADILSKRNNDMNSPPSSNDSNYSNSQMMISKAGPSSQFASLTGAFKHNFKDNNLGGSINAKNSSVLTSTPLFKNQSSNIGYPEVTLHPIQSGSNSQKIVNDNLSDAHANSLLHGILTKNSKLKGNSTVTTGSGFSPTLARLLTAPERSFAMSSNSSSNSTNNKPEISCLPISQYLAFQQQQQQQHHHQQNNSLLQQQLQRHQRDINKLLPKNNVYFNLDDEADDSDRLVIDEGDQYSNSELIQALAGKLEELHENELPECQGCKKREAQFVCADCKRQWYCSRECQVIAWDEHSEVCAR